jgi:hypothetical protein
MLRKFFLICGILASLLYIATNIILAIQYDGYNAASQTVSELSAIGAPTRESWVSFMIIYTILMAAFGLGVFQSGINDRRLRIVGIILIIYVAIGIFWPPMHTREVLAAGGGNISDTLHIAFTFITVPLMLLSMAISAAAIGRGFRIYSILTILVLLVSGFITGLSANKMEANLPTPWMGAWERVGIAGFMFWVIVLAAVLLKTQVIETKKVRLAI